MLMLTLLCNAEDYLFQLQIDISRAVTTNIVEDPSISGFDKIS
jgi:hypothetical protein